MSDVPDALGLSRRARFTYGAIGSAVIVGAVAAPVLFQTRPWQGEPARYTAVFDRAGQGLDTQSDVKLHGITVGGVDSVRLDSHGHAVVRFTVRRDLRLPRDTVAEVDPVSVFGPKDLALDPGADEATGPFLNDGATIPHTRDPQEISDVAKPLSQLTSEISPDELSGLVHTWAQGLQGQGPALRRTLTNTGTLVDEGYQRRTQLRQVLIDLSALAGSVGGRGDTITSLATDLNALGPLADGQDKIDRLLDGAARLSGQSADLLTRQGADVGRLLDSSSGVFQVLAADRGDIPVLLNALNSLLGGLGHVISYPGPGTTLLGKIGYVVPLDLCYEIKGLCDVLRH